MVSDMWRWWFGEVQWVFCRIRMGNKKIRIGRGKEFWLGYQFDVKSREKRDKEIERGEGI